jgi:hypothetical protein
LIVTLQHCHHFLHQDYHTVINSPSDDLSVQCKILPLLLWRQSFAWLDKNISFTINSNIPWSTRTSINQPEYKVCDWFLAQVSEEKFTTKSFVKSPWHMIISDSFSQGLNAWIVTSLNSITTLSALLLMTLKKKFQGDQMVDLLSWYPSEW